MFSAVHTSPNDYAAKALVSKSDLLWRVDGIAFDGTNHWYYVLVDASKLDAFKRALRQGYAIKPGHYGKIIADGMGDTPSPEALAYMRALGFEIIA